MSTLLEQVVYDYKFMTGTTINQLIHMVNIKFCAKNEKVID